MKLALAGDTMLGRSVAHMIVSAGPGALFADEVVDITRSADLFVLNLECCISDRGTPRPEPRKPFFFRAPPATTEVLNRLREGEYVLLRQEEIDEAAGERDQRVLPAGVRSATLAPRIRIPRNPPNTGALMIARCTSSTRSDLPW